MSNAPDNPPLPEIKRTLKSWLEAQTSLRWKASTDKFAGHHPRMGLIVFTPVDERSVELEILNQSVSDIAKQLGEKGITAIPQPPLLPSTPQTDDFDDKPKFGFQLSLVVPSQQLGFKEKLKILAAEVDQSEAARPSAASYIEKFRTGGKGGSGSQGR